MTWKDNYRDEKDESGLTWDQFHQRRFVYADDMESLAATITTLSQQVEAMTNEYQQLRRELNEVKIMMESDDFDP